MDNEKIKEAIEILVEYTSSHMCSKCLLHEICMEHWRECPEYWDALSEEENKNA